MRAAFLVLALMVGCGINLRAGASPTVDTTGRVGAQLYLGGAFGLADEKTGNWLLAAHGEASYLSGGEGGLVAVPVGAELAVLGRVSWRAGLRWGLGTSLDTHHTFAFIGISAAVLPRLEDVRSWRRGFGVELRAFWVGGEEWNDAAQFSLGVVYELYRTMNFTIIP